MATRGVNPPAEPGRARRAGGARLCAQGAPARPAGQAQGPASLPRVDCASLSPGTSPRRATLPAETRHADNLRRQLAEVLILFDVFGHLVRFNRKGLLWDLFEGINQGLQYFKSLWRGKGIGCIL